MSSDLTKPSDPEIRKEVRLAGGTDVPGSQSQASTPEIPSLPSASRPADLRGPQTQGGSPPQEGPAATAGPQEAHGRKEGSTEIRTGQEEARASKSETASTTDAQRREGKTPARNDGEINENSSKNPPSSHKTTTGLVASRVQAFKDKEDAAKEKHLLHDSKSKQSQHPHWTVNIPPSSLASASRSEAHFPNTRNRSASPKPTSPAQSPPPSQQGDPNSYTGSTPAETPQVEKDGSKAQKRPSRIPLPTSDLGRQALVTTRGPANNYEQLHDTRISQQEATLLSRALDTIIAEHGHNLRDIATRLSTELNKITDPLTPADDERTLTRTTGDSNVPLLSPKSKHVTFAALPAPWRPEKLEVMMGELLHDSEDIAKLITKIEFEIEAWSDMLEQGWDGGKGSVLGATAMEAQEERANAVGLWSPHGVPRPLRARTYSHPTERLGWLDDVPRSTNEQPPLARRDTVWFESEEWPNVSEGA